MSIVHTKNLINSMTNNEFDEFKDYFSQHLMDNKLNKKLIDVEDENGMTCLEHASFKGQQEICKWLIKNGADVDHKQSNGELYTPLMYAALSGSLPTVHLLLNSGACVDSKNKVNRTASQLASFIGNKMVANLINNFINFETIEYFTKKQGVEKIPKLPRECIEPLRGLLMLCNYSPIQIIKYLKKNVILLEKNENVIKTLETMLSQCVDPNFSPVVKDSLAIKIHYILQIVRHILKNKTDDYEESCYSSMKLLAKKIPGNQNCTLMKPNEDRFIRYIIMTFPYERTSLIQQLKMSLSACKETSSFSILGSAINTIEVDDENENSCATCTMCPTINHCAKCQKISYCDELCHKLDWPFHRTECGK
ncbi:hypothetical protein SNEBB_010609 [Seison nebaliae]|nr:hypothetical protein SNEBB_010609 [Seison nebaliae]